MNWGDEDWPDYPVANLVQLGVAGKTAPTDRERRPPRRILWEGPNDGLGKSPDDLSFFKHLWFSKLDIIIFGNG